MAKQRSGAGNHIEVIEVFDPNDVSPWPDASSFVAETFDVPYARKGSGRGVVLAALMATVAGVVGVIALGDDSTPESAVTTTSAATPPTVRSALDPASPAHYLIDDPAFTPYAADIVTPPQSGQQVQVWTNGTAFGPVVILELHPHPYEPYGIVGATRSVVGGIDLVHPIAQPDAVISEVAVDVRWSVTVLATRLSDEEVAEIANSVQVVDGELPDDYLLMEELQLGLTFEDETLDDLIFGRVESEVRYLTADGEVATLRSAVGSSEHRLEAFRFLTTDAQPFFYGSSHGRLPNGDTVVVWEDQGRLLSLVAPSDPADLIPDDLIRVVPEVRPATDSEWSAMVYGLRPDYRLGDFETLATGHASNSELWRAGPQITERRGRTEFLWWWTVPGLDDVTASAPASLMVGTRPRFDTLVVPGATFVFVSQPGEGGTVTVRTATGVEFVAELMRPFEQSEVWMTVVRIEEPGSVTVNIDSYGVGQLP